MIRIVDPHVHIWDLRTGLYPRREARRDAGDESSGDYLIDDLRRDAEGIALAKAVHVEAFPTDGLAEVRHVNALCDAAEAALPIVIIANADLADPGADHALRQLAAIPRVRGIRQALNRPDDDRNLLDEPAWTRGFGLLEGHGLSFDLQLSPEQIPAAAAVLEAHPQTRVVLNHIGWPRERGFASWRRWRDGLCRLGSLPNVQVKLSGFGMFDPSWTIESIRPFVFEALEHFGPERAMFASNFPVDRRWRPYRDLWRAYAALVEDFPDAVRSGLLGGNAERFYRM